MKYILRNLVLLNNITKLTQLTRGDKALAESFGTPDTFNKCDGRRESKEACHHQ